MSKRWLESREPSSVACWGVGCYDCKEQEVFSGKESEGQALTWYGHHVCSGKPAEDLDYLTSPRLRVDVTELLHWASPTTRTSAKWALENLVGKGFKMAADDD